MKIFPESADYSDYGAIPETFEPQLNVMDIDYSERPSIFVHGISIGAILCAVLLTGAGVNYWASAAHRPITILEHSGGVALTSEELVGHISIPGHHGNRYWLGPRPGYSYTTNCMTEGVLKVTYLAPGQMLTSGTIPKLSISAYENRMFYSNSMVNDVAAKDIAVTNARGDVITYTLGNLTRYSIDRVKSPEIIVLQYAQPKDIKAVISDSEILAPIISKDRSNSFRLF